MWIKGKFRDFLFQSFQVAELKWADSTWEEIARAFEFPISTYFTIACTVNASQVPIVYENKLQFPHSLSFPLSPSHTYYTVSFSSREGEMLYCFVLVWIHLQVCACWSGIYRIFLFYICIFIEFNKGVILFWWFVISTLMWFQCYDRCIFPRIHTNKYLLHPSIDTGKIGMFLLHMDTLTHHILLFLSAFPPLCLSDGVELTGAESFTVSGSKDKLLNTHAEVTYVLARLPDSFSSPNQLNLLKSVFVTCFPLFSTRSYFLPLS